MNILFCSFLIVSSFTITVSSDCVSGELSSHPASCDMYLICDNGVFVEMSCAPGTHFNPDINICDWPSDVNNCADGNRTTTSKPILSDCQCEIELAPLYHLLRTYDSHHFYTPSKQEADKAVSFDGIEYRQSPGLIAKNGLDCHCRASLKYANRLYRYVTAENPIDEHFFTLDIGEIAYYVNTLRYKWEGFDNFYCSTIAGDCGATVPLYRYLKDGKHYFSTTMDGQEDATYEGVTCYIWPTY